MKTYLLKIASFINDEEGASAVEYGLLVGLIAVAIIAAVTALGTSLSGMFNGISTTIGAVPTS
jgi:pilus assembly protein Flp/PilA